jgi:hypothetical protein
MRRLEKLFAKPWHIMTMPHESTRAARYLEGLFNVLRIILLGISD